MAKPTENKPRKLKVKARPAFDLNSFLTSAARGRQITVHEEKHLIFSQGDSANAVFYLQSGKVKLQVVSRQGKEAVVAVLDAGDFFGEGCLAGQPLRMATAICMSVCSVVRLEKTDVVRALHEQPQFSEVFVAHRFPATSVLKKTWWTTCSIRARNGGHEYFSCSRTSARKAHSGW